MPKKLVFACACGCGTLAREAQNWLLVAEDSGRLSFRPWNDSIAERDSRTEYLASRACCCRFVIQWLCNLDQAHIPEDNPPEPELFFDEKNFPVPWDMKALPPPDEPLATALDQPIDRTESAVLPAQQQISDDEAAYGPARTTKPIYDVRPLKRLANR